MWVFNMVAAYLSFVKKFTPINEEVGRRRKYKIAFTIC